MPRLSIISGYTIKSFGLRRNKETYEVIEYEGTTYKLEASFELRRHRECYKLAQEISKERKVVLTTGMIENRVWVGFQSTETELK